MIPIAGVGIGDKVEFSDRDRHQRAYEIIKNNDILSKNLLDIPRQMDSINRQASLKNNIKVEPPKLEIKVYVDGKHIPAKFDYDSIRKAVSKDFLIQSRRYGKE
jgi:hypothetical protein